MPQPDKSKDPQKDLGEKGKGSQPDADELEKAKVIADLKGQVETLTKELTETKKTIFSPEYIQSLRGPKEEKAEEPPAVDLNELDNVGVAKHLADALGKVIEERDERFSKQLNSLVAQQAILRTKMENPDFDKYLPQMQEIAKRLPGLHPGDMLKLAKADDPELMKAYEEKIIREKAEAEKAAAQSTVPGPGTGFNLEEVEKLPPGEAMSKAFDEIVGDDKVGGGTLHADLTESKPEA